ncbi:MAG: hypothetical protein KAH68_07700 [Draconibacterium sp.]|nr:hypothetical protein [Draconibacterium sp.]
MKAIEQFERLKRMNELIKAECTGTPEEFARMLRISQSHLFNLVEDLKIKGAPIKYSRTKGTYYYVVEFEIRLNYSVCFIKEDRLKQIFGGFIKNMLYSNFCRVKESILATGLKTNP